jgi:uncharacterized protein (DUF1778 family)
VSVTIQTSKDARIDLRVSHAQKALLEMAAASQGTKLSDFVISSSTDAAETTLANQSQFFLPEELMKKFLDCLEEEPTEIQGLKDLFARKSVFE